MKMAFRPWMVRDRKHLCQAVHECFTDLNINVGLTL